MVNDEADVAAQAGPALHALGQDERERARVVHIGWARRIRRNRATCLISGQHATGVNPVGVSRAAVARWAIGRRHVADKPAVSERAERRWQPGCLRCRVQCWPRSSLCCKEEKQRNEHQWAQNPHPWIECPLAERQILVVVVERCWLALLRCVQKSHWPSRKDWMTHCNNWMTHCDRTRQVLAHKCLLIRNRPPSSHW